jgi:hypothetical protein
VDFSNTQRKRGDIRLTGLDKNIHYIIATTQVDYGIPNKDMDSHLLRLSNNFFCEIAKQIADTSISLYRKTKDREHTHAFMCIAYEIEMNWRAYRPRDTLLLVMANPDSFDPITFNDILSLSPGEESLLYHRLKSMPYKDYLFTPTWRSIRSEMLRMYNYTCNRCGNTRNLQCHHNKYDYCFRDWLGLYYLEILCDDCHNHHHGVVQQKKS